MCVRLFYSVVVCVMMLNNFVCVCVVYCCNVLFCVCCVASMCVVLCVCACVVGVCVACCDLCCASHVCLLLCACCCVCVCIMYHCFCDVLKIVHVVFGSGLLYCVCLVCFMWFPCVSFYVLLSADGFW